jgi:hypothetical protein
LKKTNVVMVLALFGSALFARPIGAGFAEGHEIVAVIAADDLTPTAIPHVAQILGVPASTGLVEKAMAAASIRPDTEFREEDRSTASWHYIDICLQDNQHDLPARCPSGDCVTAKIDEYARRLRDRDYDKWGAAGDLAFLIHFVGDIHQPLHAATNADRGGTCQRVNVAPPEENLHYAGMMQLLWFWRSSLERPSLRRPLGSSKRSTRLPVISRRGNRASQSR